MTIKDDLLRAAAYIGATNDSPDDEATISAAEGDRIAGVLRDLAARVVQPAPGLSDLIPPSAAEWFAEAPGIANHDWRGGWDACRNRIHTLVDERTRGVALPHSRPRCRKESGMCAMTPDGAGNPATGICPECGVDCGSAGVKTPDGARR